ncbi:MAG: hypothetical protein GYA57_16655 [Myxococcales bacterium]|nr:hypothetical protein [Myxococcales bacterium]
MRARTVRRVRATVVVPAALALALAAVSACDDESENPAGGIEFAQEAQTVAESAGYVDLVVQRNGGTTGEVTVRVATQAGTATAGADFEAVAATLTWADGEAAPATVRVPILGDVLAESAETFTVVLSDPTNGAELGRAVATVTITDAPCTEISEDIDTDTTFPRGCYHVTDNIRVNATVTIEAGATFVFDQDVGLYFETSGVLRATGTADAPVVFTGVEPIRGYWESLEFYDCATSESVLDHVIVEYAGGDGACGGLVLRNGTRAAVRDSVLRNSGTYGACLDRDVQLTWARNTLTGNVSGAAEVNANAVGLLDDASTYSGNDNDLVRVSTYSGSPTVDQTWPAIDVEYRIEGRLWPTCHLTIAAGAELVFEQDAEVYLESSGILTAVGTAEAPIVFRGVEDTRGYWDGIELYATDSLHNRLEHVRIENGGDPANGCGLSLANDARAVLRESVIRRSAGYGLCVQHGVELTFENNELTDNGLGPAAMDANAVGFLDAASTYTGNAVDFVFVRTNSSYPERDQTWSALDVPYRVDGRLWPTCHWTIAAGAELVFEQDAEVYLESSGTLTAVGTAEAPILFRGLEPTAGYWDGVELYGSNSVDNRFEYVTISGGGAEGDPTDANLRLGSNARASVTNCTITNSAGWGVWVGNLVTVNADLETANSFSSNALGDVYREP